MYGPRYLNMFGGENFYAWKLKTSFLWKKGLWNLVISQEQISTKWNVSSTTGDTPIVINIQGRVSEEGVNDGIAINYSIAKWIECDFNILFAIAYYLKNESL